MYDVYIFLCNIYVFIYILHICMYVYLDAFKNDTEFQDERAGFGVLNVINDTHIEYEHYES